MNSSSSTVSAELGFRLVVPQQTIVPLVARIRAEEALLRSQFGAEYDAFRGRTWRMIPWVW